MAYDLTIADKARFEELVADGKWRPLRIGATAKHRIPAQDGFIQIDLYGEKSAGSATVWLRFQRYPSLDSTAWASFAVTGKTRWGIGHSEHMTFKDGELYGVDYMVEPTTARLRIKNRVLKGGRCG